MGGFDGDVGCAVKDQTFTVVMNFNRIEHSSWIDVKRRADGDYDLIGMGRRVEYDAETGQVVSDVESPTGVTGRMSASTFMAAWGVQ